MQRLAQALDDIDGRAYKRWHSLRYGSISPALIRAMADELLDHVAARTVTEPGLDAAAGTVAVTAAECVHGVLSIILGGSEELSPGRVREIGVRSGLGDGREHVVEAAERGRGVIACDLLDRSHVVG